MRSVSNGLEVFKGVRKGVKFADGEVVYHSPNGLMRKMHIQHSGDVPPQLEGKKRGQISTFSQSSARRLRELLFFKHIPNGLAVGFTLTIPWLSNSEISNEENLPIINQEFNAAFKRFRMSFVRQFSSSSLIWRIELTKRKRPHLHCVGMISTSDRRATDCGGVLSAFEVCHLWEQAVLSPSSKLDPNSLNGFLKNGTQFKVVPLDDNGNRLFSYLIDHTSKSKQEQLGWKGRQWGVLGGDNLRSRDDVKVLYNERNGDCVSGDAFQTNHQKAVFWRTIKKCSRYLIEDGSGPFGSRHSRGRKVGVIFGVSPRTVSRAFDYAKSRS